MTLSSGIKLGRYEIRSKIGAGGMGEVYLAQDTSELERTVVIKVLPSEVASDPKRMQRFVQEARTVSALNHPNILTIYEFGQEGATRFIATEHVGGMTLREHLRTHRMKLHEVLDIAVQVAAALDAAHEAHIIHRDIKPENIMIRRDGVVKVLDFGLAKLSGPASTQIDTQAPTRFKSDPGTVVGTANYMSPEQVRALDVDPRADIWSLGVVLYELVAGRLPFAGATTGDVIAAIIEREPPALARFAPEAPHQLERIVTKALTKNREERYQTVKDLLLDLKALRRELEFAAELDRKVAPELRPTKSLAVLYFENLSGAKEDEYFRDGISEDITTELSKIRELWVLTRSAVVAFRNKPTTASEVGRQLNAAYVLEGSLRRAGSQLRITARLVHTDTERSVWAERYDRKLEDVFAIQDEIAQSIAKALKVMLSDEEKRAIAKTPTVDIQAYDYYLRGLQHFHRHKGFDFARQMFARAIVIDPAYARAYAGEADCCSFLYMYFEPLEANLKEADAASRKAVELDPELAEAHASRGLVNLLQKRYREAEAEFEAATRLNPKLFEPYYFRGRTSFSQGKLEEAAHWFEEAFRVSAEDHLAPSMLRMVYTALGRKADALAVSSQAVQLVEGHLQIEPEDANALLRGAQCLVSLGDKERALKWMQRVQNIDPDEPVVLYNVACTYAVLGESEKAIEWLQKIPPRGEWFKGGAEHDPDLDSLRNDPRVQALLRR